MDNQKEFNRANKAFTESIETLNNQSDQEFYHKLYTMYEDAGDSPEDIPDRERVMEICEQIKNEVLNGLKNKKQ